MFLIEAGGKPNFIVLRSDSWLVWICSSASSCHSYFFILSCYSWRSIKTGLASISWFKGYDGGELGISYFLLGSAISSLGDYGIIISSNFDFYLLGIYSNYSFVAQSEESSVVLAFFFVSGVSRSAFELSISLEID
jgi:hypothetical protein